MRFSTSSCDACSPRTRTSPTSCWTSRIIAKRNSFVWNARRATPPIVPRERRVELLRKTEAAVKDRLTKEINYWDHRAEELKLKELAGHINAKINSGKARSRADELQARLQRRLQELDEERQLFPLPPVVVGGALVIPGGYLARLKGTTHTAKTTWVGIKNTVRSGT